MISGNEQDLLLMLAAAGIGLGVGIAAVVFAILQELKSPRMERHLSVGAPRGLAQPNVFEDEGVSQRAFERV